MACLCALLAAFALSGCGYHAVYGGADGERLHVVLVRSLVPDAVASDEVVAGVREGLAAEGALADGSAYPRVEIEVLREDEVSEGVRAPKIPAADGAGTQLPEARGVSRGLVVRAWLKRAKDAPLERDTGDLRAFDAIAAGRATPGGPLDLTAALFSASDAARATGRRLGHRIALRVLGFPVSSDDSGGVDR